MIQQPTPSYNFTVTRSHNVPTQTKLHTATLPSILIDFTAMTLCDLMPARPVTRRRSLPELVFFVQKITHLAQINARTLLVALIYLQRAKSNLPKRAAGGDDTNHRMFLGALLLASKFLKNSAWTTTTNTLSNRRIYEICGGLFSLEDVCQLERAFLKLIQYNCWVDDQTLNNFVQLHRADFSL
ncbi:cyclin domain-containing protein [Mucor mucedo]|uniref:cyclin domain-containing protein n=1 Tax=Mucor mucedo TaxID=29922 RepID=UPI0022209AB4|nr:cyclin domain-containing protein [Mucor mucedo]KAI7889365.1 cyclin domain-containing protein [Mucor mucedo]